MLSFHFSIAQFSNHSCCLDAQKMLHPKMSFIHSLEFFFRKFQRLSQSHHVFTANWTVGEFVWCNMQDARCKMQNARCKMLVVSSKMLALIKNFVRMMRMHVSIGQINNLFYVHHCLGCCYFVCFHGKILIYLFANQTRTT